MLDMNREERSRDNLFTSPQEITYPADKLNECLSKYDKNVSYKVCNANDFDETLNFIKQNGYELISVDVYKQYKIFVVIYKDINPLTSLLCLPEDISNEMRWVLYGKNFKSGSPKCPYIYDKKSDKVFALTKESMEKEMFLNLEDTISLYDSVKNGTTSVYNGDITGIGYYFYNSKHSVIDLDNCFYDGTKDLRQSFKKLVDNCKDKTYIGYSSSAKGLHIIVKNDIELAKWEFKLKDLKKAYEKAGINIDKELKTDGKTPGIDFLCDKKFVALTGNQYNTTTVINYYTSDYKKIYDLFSKYIEKETKGPKQEYKKKYQNYTSGSKVVNGKLFVDDYFNYIKSKVTLFDVVAMYSNSRLLDGNLHTCPLHANSHNKSFQVSRDNNKYVCYSTSCFSRQGDIFDFTKHINNLSDNKQVAEKLNSDFNLGLIFGWKL